MPFVYALITNRPRGTMPKRSELKLTKRAVDALEVEGKDAVFWDRDLAGFGVRVHPTGRKVYVVQTRGPGGPKRVTLGRHGELSTDEARKRAVPVIDRIKRGEALTPKPPEPALTVADLAERFMRVHVETHLKPGTAASYRFLLKKHILPALGGMEIRTSRASASLGAAPQSPRHAQHGQRCGRRSFQNVLAGRGVGVAPSREESLPGGAALQDAPTRAVPDE